MLKDKDAYNEYMNAYMKRRYALRREHAVAQLGGECVHCGSTHNLHFDHIDPSTKVATIARMSSMSEAKFKSEIDKCQLLCEGCHKLKTANEGSNKSKALQVACLCGKVFPSDKSYAGHRTHCNMGR